MRDARKLLAVLLGASIAVVSAVSAQQTDRIARVGWVDIDYGKGPSPRTEPLESFRARLREHGWVEGKNLVLEARIGEGQRAGEFSSELVRAKAEVIFASGPMVRGVLVAAGGFRSCSA